MSIVRIRIPSSDILIQHPCIWYLYTTTNRAKWDVAWSNSRSFIRYPYTTPLHLKSLYNPYTTTNQAKWDVACSNQHPSIGYSYTTTNQAICRLFKSAPLHLIFLYNYQSYTTINQAICRLFKCAPPSDILL